MLRQTRAQLADAPVEVPRLHDLGEKACRQRLLGGEVLRQQQLPLGARSPERGDQPRVVGNRQAIAERARDRNAEARAGRRDAKVARRRDRKPAADGKSLDHCQRRHRQRLDAAENAFHLLLVGDAVVAAAERSELRMSVPAMKALPPAPRNTATRSPSSSRIRAQASPSCSYMRHVMALRAAGRSKTTVAMSRSRA